MLNGKDTIICLIAGYKRKTHSINEWFFQNQILYEQM